MDHFEKFKWRQSEYQRFFDNETHFIKEENITNTFIFSPTFFEDFQGIERQAPKKIWKVPVVKKTKFPVKKNKKKKKETPEEPEVEKKIDIPTVVTDEPKIGYVPYSPPKLNVSNYNDEIPTYGEGTSAKVDLVVEKSPYEVNALSNADRSPFSIQVSSNTNITDEKVNSLELLNKNDSIATKSGDFGLSFYGTGASESIERFEPYRPPKVTHRNDENM